MYQHSGNGHASVSSINRWLIYKDKSFIPKMTLVMMMIMLNETEWNNFCCVWTSTSISVQMLFTSIRELCLYLYLYLFQIWNWIYMYIVTVISISCLLKCVEPNPGLWCLDSVGAALPVSRLPLGPLWTLPSTSAPHLLPYVGLPHLSQLQSSAPC